MDRDFICIGKRKLFVFFLQARGSCASYVSGFMTFMSIGGFPSFVEDMKVSSIIVMYNVVMH